MRNERIPRAIYLVFLAVLAPYVLVFYSPLLATASFVGYVVIVMVWCSYEPSSPKMKALKESVDRWLGSR